MPNRKDYPKWFNPYYKPYSPIKPKEFYIKEKEINRVQIYDEESVDFNQLNLKNKVKFVKEYSYDDNFDYYLVEYIEEKVREVNYNKLLKIYNEEYKTYRKLLREWKELKKKWDIEVKLEQQESESQDGRRSSQNRKKKEKEESE